MRARSSSGVRATRSMTPLSNAAWDERLAASRTACFRPVGIPVPKFGQAADEGDRIVGHLRGHGILGCPSAALISAVLVLLGCSGEAGAGGPPICTGVAAPRLVPGAMAATWVA